HLGTGDHRKVSGCDRERNRGVPQHTCPHSAVESTTIHPIPEGCDGYAMKVSSSPSFKEGVGERYSLFHLHLAPTSPSPVSGHTGHPNPHPRPEKVPFHVLFPEIRELHLMPESTSIRH